jgi:hypothetical protein
VSLSLEFYTVSWAQVQTAIGCRRRRLFSEIRDQTDAYFEEWFEPEDFEGGPDIEAGLERWIEGEVAMGETLPHRVEHLGDALGFVALTRFYGRQIGSLNHTITSGDLFRESFLLGAAQQLLNPPFSLEELISRPILRYESEDFPFWGGLSNTELSALRSKLQEDAPTWEADPDIDTWLLELWNALGAAVEEGQDLITIYS